MIDYHLTDAEFEQAARDALDELPADFAARLEGVAVVIEGHHPNRRVLGVFDPRGGLRRIVLYRDTIEATSPTREDCLEQIRVTVLHEVGHLFGMSEERLRRAGYG
jgi:predicted Zn-dependent protease with MMP-like domain